MRRLLFLLMAVLTTAIIAGCGTSGAPAADGGSASLESQQSLACTTTRATALSTIPDPEWGIALWLLPAETALTAVGRTMYNESVWLLIDPAASRSGWVAASALQCASDVTTLRDITDDPAAPALPLVTGDPSLLCTTTDSTPMYNAPVADNIRLQSLSSPTGVTVAKRNADSSWLLIEDPFGDLGWSQAATLDCTFDLAVLPVVE